MSMIVFIRPLLFAVFLWWFITGLIFLFYGRAPIWRHLFFSAATISAAAALGGVFLLRGRADEAGVYLSLSAGIVLWGWQVASYYLGYITGPLDAARMPDSKEPLRFRERFRLALRASQYHELVILSVLLLLIAITWQSANKWALWIYITLWVMHSLAKINVFLGVRNFRIDYLPEHLHFLDRLLPRRKNNPLLMCTVFLATALGLGFSYRAIMPGLTPSEIAGPLVISTIILLGVFEHLLLVLPIRAMLWGWGLKSLPPSETGLPAASRPQTTGLKTISKQIAEG